MKNIYRFLCLMLCMAGFGLSAYAAGEFSDMEIDYNRSTGVVSISGKADFSENTAEPVRLMVLKPGTDVEKLISGEISFEQYGVHADEVMLTDKSFAFDDFKILATYPADRYIIRIATDGVVWDGVIPVGTEAQALAFMNNAAPGTVGRYIEGYNDVYGFDIGENSIFASLDPDKKQGVYTRLEGRTYQNKAALQLEFNRAVWLQKIYQGPWGSVSDIIAANAGNLTLDLSSYNSLLNDDERDSVCKKLAGVNYTDVTALATAFGGYVNAEILNNTQQTPQGGGGGNRGGGGGGIVVSGTTNEKTNNPSVSESIFSDLSSHGWAKESIEELYNKGIVNGKSDGQFAPDDLLTRAEAVKIIVLAFFDIDASATCDFSDVPENSWMYPYIATAYELGIINGYSDNLSGAGESITREDLSVMIMRAAHSAGVTLGSGVQADFSDSEQISEYAKDAVSALSGAGIINGMGDGSFAPKSNATRAQTAKIIAGII